MYDDKHPRLRLVTFEPDPVASLADRVAQYAAEIEARRRQLEDELGQFETKLLDLEQLDPLDFTGLGLMYRNHAANIRRLLSEFENDPTTH